MIRKDYLSQRRRGSQRVEVEDSMLKTEVRATERERSEVRDQ